MKIGDKLLCKTSHDNCYTINKLYEITWISDKCYKISSDYFEDFYFGRNDNHGTYYKEYFYTQEELRMKKIDSL